MTDLIQNAAAKVASPAKKSPATRMREVLSMQGTQSLMSEVLRDNREQFVASLIDLYGSDAYLQQCDPGSVLQEALKAVSLKLPINKQLGFAYILPFRDGKTGMQVPTFVLGYRGLVQLCMRTGAYRHINAGPVYEGELRSIDKLRGDIDLSGEATGTKIIGYFGYIETLNGFAKAIYWPTEKVVEHAKKYSKNYGGKIWTENFSEMATKTVLRYLLSHWGVMSVDLINAESAENTEIADQAIVADTETGEIIPPAQTTGTVE